MITDFYDEGSYFLITLGLEAKGIEGTFVQQIQLFVIVTNNQGHLLVYVPVCCEGGKELKFIFGAFTCLRGVAHQKTKQEIYEAALAALWKFCNNHKWDEMKPRLRELMYGDLYDIKPISLDGRDNF